MDKFMDSPWFLRSTALLLALILFFSVQAEEKSNGKAVGDAMDIIRDIPVQVYYDNENLVVTGVPETVNMTIEGPANIVQTTKLVKDFTLRVDLSSLPMGKHSVRIQHENISDKLEVRLDPATINVVIEEKITQSFRVDPELNERLLADGFFLEKIDVVPATIEVTGAKSVIESISFVKASVTGEKELNKSFEQQTRVRVLDRDLTKLNVTIVPEQVNVKVEIAEYNKEVPVVLNIHGAPAEGITVESVAADEKTIRLFGPRKVVDQFKEFKVDVDMSDVKKPGTMEVELKKPKGVSAMSLNKIKVKVAATTTDSDLEVFAPDESDNPESPDTSEKPAETVKVVTKEFKNVPITVRGLDEKFKSSFRKPVNGFVVLTVTAEQKVIDTLNNSDFTVYIDASETVDAGEQVLPVIVEGPPDVQWEISDKEVTMQIELA
ncbi:YbbR-like domain-containing protein [Sporosarcina sp. JAI121]|uniref:CdaR family protein n=1 Tax=Sporosarcina sp. JAI121 TaxID=2723064 RepID=UPI0015C94374|nr:CdaR family protein [Sporosarcina sp. JAI121]NYF25819.1 YbbR domain-containing protein [Sporosarcina sp. JAI121]